MVRVPAQVPGGEHPGGQLRLAVPWRHQDHQPGAQAGSHVITEALETAGDVAVDPAGVVAGVDPLGEVDQVTLGQDP